MSVTNQYGRCGMACDGGGDMMASCSAMYWPVHLTTCSVCNSDNDDAKDLETGLLDPLDSPAASPRLHPAGLSPVAELPLPPPGRQLSKGLSDSGGRLSDTSCIELQTQTVSDLGPSW